MGWGLEWGIQWGQELPSTFGLTRLDAVLQANDLEVSSLVDAAIRLIGSGTVGADANLSGTVDAAVGIDVFVSRDPTVVYKRRYVQPGLFIELQLPSGTLYLTNLEGRKFASKYWTSRLLSSSPMLRTMGVQQDDFVMRLADAGRVISSNFSDSTPPEGALVVVNAGFIEDQLESLFELFRGRVEEVSRIAPGELELQIVRADAVDDRLIGELFDESTYPNAPPETIGRMIPQVYGTIDVHEGLVTDFNAKDVLDVGVIESDTTFQLVDASEFPTSGTGQIGDEEFTWSGKTGNQLTGVTRAVNGTRAAAYAAGQQVIEKGTFEVVFANHALGDITNVKIMDAEGDLQDPIPTPVKDPANGKVTWDQTPRLRKPSVNSDIIRAGFAAAGGSNQATNPTFAAREHVDYNDLNYASIAASQRLELTRNVSLPDVGAIVRAYLVVMYDPAGGAGAVAQLGSTPQTVGSLTQQDNTPEDMVRRYERTLGVTYDVQDPTHQHPAATRKIRIKPRQVYQFGSWDTPSGAMDADLNSYAAVQVIFPQDPSRPPSGVNPYRDVPLVLTAADFDLGSNETVMSAKFRVNGGGPAGTWDSTSNFWARLYLFPNPTPYVILLVSGGTVSSWSEVTIPDWVLNAFDGNWDRVTWQLDAVDSTFAPFACRCSEMQVEFTVSQQDPASSTNISQRRSIANYFDITTRVNGDWSYFSDSARGGTMRIQNGAASILRVNSTFFVVEHFPYEQIFSRSPRVFASVIGRIPTGKPTEIVKDILTRATPQGLGLSIDNVAQGSYTTAQQGLTTDGMRLDFALRTPVHGLQAIAQCVFEADLHQWWSQGVHFLARKADVSNLPAVSFSYTEGQLRNFTARRTRIDEVITHLETRYNWRPDKGELVKLVTDDSPASEALFGRRAAVYELAWVRDDTAAAAWGDRTLARARLPRYVISFELASIGLELRQVDFISIDHAPTELNFAKAEVIDVSIQPGVGDVFLIRGVAIVWEE